MTIYIVQLWIPRTVLRSEKVLHSRSDAQDQHKDFVKYLQKHKIESARVAKIEVEVPDPEKVLDHMTCVEIC